MPLSRLTSLVPPPENPLDIGSTRNWERVQERLGVNLPTDYKALIDCYGTGRFSIGILLISPLSKSDDHNLFHVLEVHHHANSHVQKMLGKPWSVLDPFHLYPAPDGLLPWGTTEDFTINLFWHLEGKPESWSTVIYHLGTGEYEVWKLDVVHFLLKWLTREINSMILSNKKINDDHPVRFISLPAY